MTLGFEYVCICFACVHTLYSNQNFSNKVVALTLRVVRAWKSSNEMTALFNVSRDAM